MTEQTGTAVIPRLNRSEPPPGFKQKGCHGAGWSSDCRWCRLSMWPAWATAEDVDEGWKLHEFRFDPPGLWGDANNERDRCHDVTAARSAAWAHYWRCVDLVEKALAAARRRGFEVDAADWALCLTWPEEQLAREERELAALEGAADA